jgi:hypothetical protein
VTGNLLIKFLKKHFAGKVSRQKQPFNKILITLTIRTLGHNLKNATKN